MNNFKDLYQRFRDKKATDEEKVELTKLIESGQFDDELFRTYDELVSEKSERNALVENPEFKLSESEDAEVLNAILKAKDDKAKEIPIYRRTYFKVAASVALLALFLFWLRPKNSLTLISESKEISSPVLTVKQEQITLPDGTTVMVNVGSSVTYKQDFGISSREVYLRGEAYFDVKHNPSHPFKVHCASGVTVSVLGTAFNVNAYDDQDEVTVTVTRGLVEVSKGDHVFGKLHPNEEITVSVPNSQFEIKNVESEKVLKWLLLLDDVKLSEAASMISDRYNIEIVFSNPVLEDCRIKGSFLGGEPLDHVLNSVCTVLNWNYKRDGDTVIIDGKACY